MKRNSAIASVAAATGIVAATVIAGVSLIQATATESSDTSTVTLAAPSATMPAASDLEFTPQPLPELPTISTESSSPAAASSATVSSAAPTESPSASPSASPTQATPTLLTRDYAIQAVSSATDGKITDVVAMNRNGVDVFAVTVKRTDGSVITGFVNRTTGDIGEWVVVKAAPVAQYQDDDDHDEYDDDDEHEEDDDDDHDEDEHEEDERDNDDD